jgi:hypothetical protein
MRSAECETLGARRSETDAAIADIGAASNDATLSRTVSGTRAFVAWLEGFISAD